MKELLNSLRHTPEWISHLSSLTSLAWALIVLLLAFIALWQRYRNTPQREIRRIFDKAANLAAAGDPILYKALLSALDVTRYGRDEFRTLHSNEEDMRSELIYQITSDHGPFSEFEIDTAVKMLSDHVLELLKSSRNELYRDKLRDNWLEARNNHDNGGFRDSPIDRASTIMREFAVECASELANSVQLLVLFGEPGVGKTRVVACLAEELKPKGIRAFWYSDNSTEKFFDDVGKLRRKHGSEFLSKKMCLILDENHQSGRKLWFFDNLLKNRRWEGILEHFKVVLVLRTDTQKHLSAENLLADARTKVIEPKSKEISALAAEHHIRLPLYEKQLNDLVALARAENGVTDILLLDKLWLPNINQEIVDRPADKDRYYYAYNLLMADANANRQAVLRALWRSLAFTRYVPLWLLSIVASIELGREFMPEQVLEILNDASGLVESYSVWPNLGVESWRFVHDVLADSVDRYESENPREWFSANRTKLLTDAHGLIVNRAGNGFESFREGLALWIVLSSSFHHGLPKLTSALANASPDLPSSCSNRKVVKLIGTATAWMGSMPSNESLVMQRSFFKALRNLAKIAGQYVQPNMLADICTPHKLNLVATINLLCACASQSGLLEKFGMQELAGSQVMELKDIGNTLTEGGEYDRLLKLMDARQRMRLSQILAIAGKYGEAGRVTQDTIMNARGVDENTDIYLLGRVDWAAAIYMQAGLVKQARKLYRQACQKATKLGVSAAVTVFKENGDYLSTLDGHEPKSWRDVIPRMWSTRLADTITNESGPQVYIIASWGDLLGCGALIATKIGSLGVPVHLVYSEMMKNRSLADLGKDCGIVLLGGPKAPTIKRLMLPIGEHLIEDMVGAVSSPPVFGCADFEFDGKPGVWIAGYYPWDTVVAVQHWLSSRGHQKLAELLHSTRTIDNPMCDSV